MISQDAANRLAKLESFEMEPFDYPGVTTVPPVRLVSGEIFEGQWNKENKRHGNGKLVSVDGAIREGFWENDAATGKGRIIHKDGSVYVGDWENDMPHGHGFFTNADGSTYDGQWVEDR
jgi:hypothetical protein